MIRKKRKEHGFPLLKLSSWHSGTGFRLQPSEDMTAATSPVLSEVQGGKHISCELTLCVVVSFKVALKSTKPQGDSFYI